MVFNSGKEMYEAIKSADLYSIEKEEYVFLYNEDGAVCTYSITADEAMELSRKADEYNEYWGAFLGFGGNIYDAPMDFCNENYYGTWDRCDEIADNNNFLDGTLAITTTI